MKCSTTLMCLVAGLLLLSTTSSAGSAPAGSVLVMTKDNFAKTVANNDYVLVMFITKPCSNCKTLEPNFGKAAAIMAWQKLPVKAARVDCSTEKLLEKTYDIHTFPSIRLLRLGVAVQYKGAKPTHQLSAQEIVDWTKEYISDEDIGYATVTKRTKPGNGKPKVDGTLVVESRPKADGTLVAGSRRQVDGTPVPDEKQPEGDGTLAE